MMSRTVCSLCGTIIVFTRNVSVLPYSGSSVKGFPTDNEASRYRKLAPGLLHEPLQHLINVYDLGRCGRRSNKQAKKRARNTIGAKWNKEKMNKMVPSFAERRSDGFEGYVKVGCSLDACSACSTNKSVGKRKRYSSSSGNTTTTNNDNAHNHRHHHHRHKTPPATTTAPPANTAHTLRADIGISIHGFAVT